MRPMPTRTRVLLTAAVTTAMTAALTASPALATAAPTWAPAGQATVHPGVQIHTNGAECTSNFVFTDGTSVYLGQAAHCSSTDAQTATNGCQATSLPLATKVTVEGASKPGTLVYDSWRAMQRAGETDPNTCADNDLALVRLDPADISRVNPSVPFWGGPTGLNTTGTKAGDTVLSYGNSALRAGITLLSPKQGISLGDRDGGWSHLVGTITPGIPGDSGSAFLDAQGRALGVLSTLNVLPDPGSNGVGDLNKELAYANAHAGLGTIHLVPGTQSFRGPLPGGLLARQNTADIANPVKTQNGT